MSRERSLDIIKEGYNGLDHFYIEYGKAATKFYPWKNCIGNPEFSDLLAAMQEIPFKSDDKYTFVDLCNILSDEHNGWGLAKLYFCAKKEPSASLLKWLPLHVFKEIFHFVYPRKSMDIFKEILSDINLFISCAKPITHAKCGIYAIFSDKDTHDKYKVVLAKNIKNLLIESTFDNAVERSFEDNIRICKKNMMIVKNKKTGKYKYLTAKPIEEKNRKTKTK